MTQQRPAVTIKLAQSADGFTSRMAGEDPWITGVEARRFGQLLRAQHDAILVGIDTVLIDDPELTCRIPGLEQYSPARFVIDSRLRLDLRSKLVQTAHKVPTAIFTTVTSTGELQAAGVEVIRMTPDSGGRIMPSDILRVLSGRGTNRLLVEGGATTANAFFRSGFADRLEMFTAPMSLANTGRCDAGALTVRKLREAPNFMRVSARSFGADVLESFEAKS
jgi:diaminohydroxyphosphoribosylaminopyrimidine deaminase/5-amino-6-(5-phosphoribosylamino)uracil reductase